MALLLEMRGAGALITSPSDELEVAKDVSMYKWIAWIWLLLIVVYLAITVTYGLVRFNAKRKEKANAKFVGPLGFFLSFLVNYPCLALLLGLLWPLGFSAVGLVASDFTIPVDWAVEDYMDGDSEIKFTEDAVMNAVDEQRTSLDSSSRRLTASPRFQPQTLRYWTLDVYYTAKQDGGNVFSAEAINEIKQFENDMLDFARYRDFCHVDRNTLECATPNSVVSIFDPSVSRSSDSTIEIGYDGQGDCLASNVSTLSIAGTVAALNKEGVTWWWDAGFDSASVTGWAARSQFRGGAPLLEGANTAKLSDEDKLRSKEFLHYLSDEFLSKANEGKQHVVISWQEERFLDGYETFNVLLHDMYWSVGSLLFVFLFLLFQLRSLALTIFAALGVLTSFSTAFYWYRVVAGFEAMNLINFISLFLIVGIAADDVLVMAQMYDLGQVRISEKMRTPQNTMKWAYFRAGSAMLVTTVTTCGSFFALCTSSIKVLRAFGFFMGATVAWNYINVMLIFPPVLLMVDVWSKRACPCCYSKQEDSSVHDAEVGAAGASAAAVAPAAVAPATDSDPVRSRTRSMAADSVASATASHATTSVKSGKVSRGRSRLTKQPSFAKDAKVNCISRCFRDYLGSLIWHGRWPCTCFLLWACLVLGSLAGWRMAATNADLPLFANETNIGRHHWVLDGVFESYDDAVLKQAISSFPQENTTRDTCPGVGADGCSTCSGNGRCYWDTANTQFACSCHTNWYGRACSKGVEAFQLNASAVQLSHVVILAAPEPLARAAERDLVISNDGAIPASWELDWPSRDWLEISARTGQLTEYSAGSQPPFQAIQVSFDLTGKDAPWRADVTMELSGPNSEPVSIQVQAAVVDSLSLSGISLQSGDTGELISNSDFDFSPSTLTYLVNLPYEHSSIRLVPSFDSSLVTSASVQPEGSGRRLQGASEGQGRTLESGQASDPIQLQVQEMVAVNVQANLYGASTTYTLYLVRNNAMVPEAPELVRVVAGSQSLLVTWSPPAYDGGKEVTGYQISAVSSGGVVSDTAPCRPAVCSNGFDTTGSGEACCEHVVFGLTDGESYEVSVRAQNDEGAGDTAVPACSPSCFWPPVVVGNEMPAISAAPTVKVVANGEVEVSLAMENVSAGGAVPLRFTCTSSPQVSANSSSSAPDDIPISQLSSSEEYTFSCTLTNAALETSSASPSSPAIFPSLITRTATTVTATIATTVTTGSSSATLTELEFEGSLELQLGSEVDPSDQEAYEAATRQAIANLLGVPVSAVQITSVSRRLSGQERRLQSISVVQFTVTGTSSAGDLEDQISGLSSSELNGEVNDALSEQGVDTTASVNGFGIVQPTPAPTPPGATFTSTTRTRVTNTATQTTTTFATTTLITSTLTTFVTATSQTTTTGTTTTQSTSTDTTVTITGVAPPSAPAVAASASGAGEVTVSVTARQSNGAPIESFSCVASQRGQVQSAMLAPNDGGTAAVVFSGLTEGLTYEFSCTATNVEGTSDRSEEAPVMAIGLPAPPIISAVTVTGSAELTIELTHSSSTSAPVDTTRCRAVQDVLVAGTLNEGETAITLAGLTPGVAYTFECNATNGAGTSSFSQASSPAVTALLPPIPPAFACLTPGTEEVAVSIHAETSSIEHDTVTTVQCYRYTDGSEALQLFDASPFGSHWVTTITGLPIGEELQVQCTAYSEHFPSLAVKSNVSDIFITGHQLTAEYRLRSAAGFAGINHAELRGFFHEQLSGVVLERIFVSTSTDGGSSFNKCIHSEGVGIDEAHSLRRLSASTMVLVRARVLVDEMSRGANSATIEALNSLTSILQSWASAETGANVEAQLTQEADILGPAFSLSTLESLTIVPQGAGHPDPMLDPPFNASFRGPYYANVTGITFRIEPTASNSVASVRINGDEAGEIYEIETHSIQHRYTIVVTAEDQISTSTYLLWISYPAVPCSANCLNGYCDFLYGQCRCNEGYFEGTSMCSAFCPGNVSKCSGRGRCCDDFILSQSIQVQESFGCYTDDYDTCACELSYTGPDCSQRECPPCQNNRTCIEGTQDLDSSWTCDCADEFTGDLCEFKKCPNDCSGLGVCDTDTGKCNCLQGFGSEDCSFELGEQVPIESAVEVQLVWGIKEYNDTYHPVYDPSFSLGPDMQLWILDTCAAARADAELQVRQELTCWIEKFAEDAEAPNSSTGFPVDELMAGQQLEDWFEHADNQDYILDLGTAGSGYSGQIRYARVRMKINVELRAHVNDLEEHYLRWVKFVDQRNGGAPQGGRLLMVSPAWTRMDVELTMIRSSIVSVILSLSISFGVVTLFTGNLLLSSYTILTICLSMMTLFFFLIWVIGMEFGPIQIIGLTTFVGLSVDYTLHTCHGYNESADETSRGKTTDALMRLGPAIVGGALTTAGATCFLFACWILPFYQLGVMLFLNTLITLFLTFFFLMPLLMIAGPRGEWCNIYALLFCRALRRALESPDELEADHAPEVAPIEVLAAPAHEVPAAPAREAAGASASTADDRAPAADRAQPAHGQPEDDEGNEDNNMLV